MTLENLVFVDNPVAGGSAGRYDSVTVDAAKILKSWKLSLFSYEWLLPDGRVKEIGELPEKEQPKRAAVEDLIKNGKPLEKPVLGIGLMENVEIGAGRAVFLTLAAKGVKSIPVHIPKSNAGEFAKFLDGAPGRTGREGEKGNVLVYILIAIALLAALSYAFSSGGRVSGQGVSTDRTKLLASEIIDYGDTVKKTVAVLRLRGTGFDQLSFAATGLNATDYGTPGNSPSNEVFNTSGGGLVYQDADSDSQTTPGSYIFTAGNEFTQVGSTCGANTCTDLAMLLPSVKKSICIEINYELGVGTAGADPPTVPAIDTSVPFKGGDTTYKKTIDNAALYGKTAGCFQETALSSYYYYEILVAR